MVLDDRILLRRLGAGETIAALCSSTRWSRDDFDRWWQTQCRQRVPSSQGQLTVRGISSSVHMRRDRLGVPHVEAANDGDLFFGFGYATAQDRLFQLEFQRRKALGRLAEILGTEAIESDLLYRTIDLPGIAAAELESLPAETRQLLAAYSVGVNAFIEGCGDNLPIEFDLLDYRPEPWKPTDSLAVAGEFRWYLTGRFPVIAIPEFVKRTLGEGPLLRAFLQGEADDESIMPPGSYTPGTRSANQAGGDENGGSNNWVLAASRTTTGKPIVASDPHVPFGAVSIWHEIHLRGGSFNVAGVAYAGMPALMIGRNERVAWGVTNNICSLRDLYLEKTDPGHPGCFLLDGKWEPASERQEIIAVRGTGGVVRTIHSSRNGPIVDDVLPGPARGKGPVSLRWVGAEPCGWLPALLGMNRARSAEEFRQATRPWSVPTFNLVFADADGHIGHQCVGRIPIRRVPARGYRPGWEPLHQWAGYLPFEDMPHQIDPPRGFAVTANNRLAPDDYPYPLSGTWSSGHRAQRIRTQLEATPRWTPQQCGQLQLDVRSGRTVACIPPLTLLLDGDHDPRVKRAVELFRAWDCCSTVDSVAASLFNVFFVHWCRSVMTERLPKDIAEFTIPNAGGLACALLAVDPDGWFHKSDRRESARAAFRAALDELTRRLGSDMETWQWGRLHTLVQKHFLSSRGDLGELLDCNGQPSSGDATTVCSTTSDANFAAALGASYRMIADLADPNGVWAVGIPGNSGNPGSPHYADQVQPWSEGALHYIALAAEGLTLTLDPAP